MSGFLPKILAAKKEEVRRAEATVPLDVLQARADARTDLRPFAAPLCTEGVRIVAEIKRASPSKGPLRPDLDPAAMARAYEAGGAAALSVLTDSPFFRGSASDLQAARAACRLPVLRKDFILFPYQVVESKAMGADAVLLIVRALSQERLEQMLKLCRRLSLDALVEIHTEKDLIAATRAGATLIGINNRDLGTFSTDVGRAAALASRFLPGQIPVAASGISSRADVEKNLAAGIRRFLIGEALVTDADPEDRLKTLIGDRR
ncbi:MAG: indole-3-glycerol phosphate synthase TrpC [Desulfobacterales bacterium]|jgi:indole-3-glycerol phosphate synthase